MTIESFKFAGDVVMNSLTLASPNRSKFLNIKDYLVELNIYESIFTPGLTGTLTLTDSRNLIKLFPLIGEELLFVDFVTPGIDADRNITKVFRVYSISDKLYAKDGSTIIYQLHFSSVEIFKNIHNPIYRAFSGQPEIIIKQIYDEYLLTQRNFGTLNSNESEEKFTQLFLLSETANNIKFVSPGWTPMECINWIASNSLPITGRANYLFWETTKGFYFGNIDSIFDNRESVNIGEYVYSETYINTQKSDDKTKLMNAIKSLSIDKSFDQMSNNMSGYLASRVLNVDLYNKQFENVDYDHGKKFSSYTHSEDDKMVPLFDTNTVRNPLTYLKLNYSYPKLHDNIDQNFDEQYKNIFGNRRSNIAELDNFKMNITIPGRTDIQVGQLIYIRLPKSSPIYRQDQNTNNDDPLYSGNYLITNICHKVNPVSHYISMTVTKDGFLQSTFKEAETL